IYTSLFIPGYWGAGGSSWSGASPWQNGAINSIELVNSADPNSPGNFIFYRDASLLPKGVAVALTNNTNTNPASASPYNPYNAWNPTAAGSPPPIDRYLR